MCIRDSPDVRPVFYAELDEQSTPRVDNNPVDFAQMIRDIDHLDRVLAQSDIRPMFDAQLDRVSTPMDDSCPLDYVSVMQELDELDKIMAAIQNELAAYVTTNNSILVTRWLTATYDIRSMGILIECQHLRTTTPLSTMQQ